MHGSMRDARIDSPCRQYRQVNIFSRMGIQTDRIVELRKARGWNQTQLAQHAGISQGTQPTTQTEKRYRRLYCQTSGA